MNSHNTDSRHFLATNIICVLALAGLLGIWVYFKGSPLEKDQDTAFFAALVAGAIMIGWGQNLLKHNERVFAALGASWEYVWLNCAGRLSMGGIRRLISSGKVHHCGFAGHEDGDASVVPPEPPED